MIAEACAGLLALAPQRSPAATPIPVVMYPVVEHRADRQVAERLTKGMAIAFRRDSGFNVLDRKPGSPPRAAQYGVLGDLHAAGGSFRLVVRVVDIKSVFLVAMESARGSRTEIERTLPAIARAVGERLRLLQEKPFAGQPPPARQIPTVVLQAHARAVVLADQGDTTGAIHQLREAMRLYPAYQDACAALRRLQADSTCGPGPRPR